MSDTAPAAPASAPKPRGPWMNRFFTRLLTGVLTLLIYWLLGFVVQDIGRIQGPDYQAIIEKFQSPSLLKEQETLGNQLKSTTQALERLREEQRLANDSAANFKQTIQQLIDLRKLSLEKAQPLQADDDHALSTSINHFMERQKAYQDLNEKLVVQTQAKRGLEDRLESVRQQLDQELIPARKTYEQLLEQHRLKVAAIKLGVLSLLLLSVARLVVKKRESIYYPIILSVAMATLIKVALVVHEYFPAKIFRYLLILVLILAVGWILIYFIRSVAFPKTAWLLKQYREAYEGFFCPTCEFPVRVGPRRFQFWTRRTIKKQPIGIGAPLAELESYTCPSCGTALFESCASCGKMRHSLLPSCQHCGAEKAEPESD